MTSSHRYHYVIRVVLIVGVGMFLALSAVRQADAQPPHTVSSGVQQQSPDDGDPPVRVLDADLIAEASVPAARTVGEAESNLRVPVTLDLPTLFPLDVTYTVEPGSAQPGVHYQSVAGTLTFSGPLDLVDYIDVPILNNPYHSGPLTFTVRLVSQSSGAPLPSAATTNVTITDDDPVPAARIETPVGGYTVSELAGAAVLTVTVPFTSTTPISITYTTEDNSATAGVDYQATTGVLTLAPGQTSAPVSVPILNNGVFTGDRFFTFRLQGQEPGTLGTPASAQVTVIDALQQPKVQFELPSFNVPRNVGTAPITVTLSAPSAFTVTTAYTMADGTALAGVDYTAGSGTLTFAAGETRQVIAVPILNSGAYVGDRAFTLGLSNPVQATFGDHPQATLLIRETNALRLYLPLILWGYDVFGEDEPNATLVTAKGPLASGAAYQGGYNGNLVDQFGLDRDTWMFTVAEPGAVTVIVNSNDPGRQAKLMNANGADVPGGYSGDPGPTATFTVNVTAAGTYYVRVYSSAQLGTGRYQLSVTHP